MTVEIERYSKHMEDVAITDDVDTTPEIPFHRWKYGMVYVPDGSSITTLTIHAAPDVGETYEPLWDNGTPSAVTITVAANRANPLPDECFGAGALKLVGNVAGTIQISLKG